MVREGKGREGIRDLFSLSYYFGAADLNHILTTRGRKSSGANGQPSTSSSSRGSHQRPAYRLNDLSPPGTERNSNGGNSNHDMSLQPLRHFTHKK